MVDILNHIVYNYNCKNKPTGRKEIDMENKNYEAIARELAKMLIKKQMPDTADDMMEMHIDSLVLTVDILLNETH